MWLQDKKGGDAKARTKVPGPLREALGRWYKGGTDSRDAAAAIELFRRGLNQEFEILCDCRGDIEEPPRIEYPAMAGGLTTGARFSQDFRPAVHHASCPFYRDPLPDDIRTLFPPVCADDDEAFWQLPASLLGKEVQAADLTSLLRRLVEAAGTNILQLSAPIMGSGHGIEAEFGRLSKAATGFKAAGCRSFSKLFTAGYRGCTKSGSAQRAKRDRSAGSASYDFVALTSHDVRGPAVATEQGDLVFKRWLSFAGSELEREGHCLVLGVLAAVPGEPEPVPLFACAQPVAFGNRFFPVTREGERIFFRNLHRCWEETAATGSLAIKRNLFGSAQRSPRSASFTLGAIDYRAQRSGLVDINVTTGAGQAPYRAAGEPSSVSQVAGPLVEANAAWLVEPAFAKDLITAVQGQMKCGREGLIEKMNQ
ncbi:hypothetical protein N8940_00695 [Sphingomonadaceae bacterium]|nr:hypothetical protein [Sphingomonadaceae bacterium]